MKISNPTLIFITVLFVSYGFLQAQQTRMLLLHETFDFPEGTELLGNQNGWQADFNNKAPSPAPLAMQFTMQASPFGQGVGRSMSLHPDNSRKTSYRQLPEPLNGKITYFSFSMKAYFHQNESVLMFRAEDGFSIQAGFLNGLFGVKIHEAVDTEQALQLQTAYFVVGKMQISDDGRKLAIAANAYTSSDQVGLSAPEQKSEWQVFTMSEHAEPRDWVGVSFRNASASAAFDDLRIGTNWKDVTGKGEQLLP
jgi:hypothetical protein